ncbi:hypothetical protein BJAS_P3978 [Bathymodiolus japonicus methanotrophic gill symbiont]|uniref:tetratricopeptide repeat protein n=1 Tax=Bathymodiolus japonicus methanotrophic gill symbiont TaxID=113269 RepID=UPI001B4C77D4|nr:hypothetical protein [Bathymodiolus japonicus methanotrophic gill symbiont]GFO73266.1 hypothetical protein BJAS_P3978 [Bathymodiolus japonicus methanotrophic gill symbiont]
MPSKNEIQELEASAALGFASSGYLLYEYYNDLNPSKALHYLKLSCEAGYEVAMFEYAKCIQDDDPHQALKLFNNLSGDDSGRSDYYSAKILEQLAITPRALKAAFNRYLKAAELGDVLAAVKISDMYANGIGCRVNNRKAKEWSAMKGADYLANYSKKSRTSSGGYGCNTTIPNIIEW